MGGGSMRWDELKGIVKFYLSIREDYPSLLLLIDGTESSVVCYDDTGDKVLELVHDPNKGIVYWRSTIGPRTIKSGKWDLSTVDENTIRQLIESGELWR